MEIFLLLAITAASEPPVSTTVVVLGEEPTLLPAANDLRAGLAADPRLRAADSVPTPIPDRELGERLETARARIAEAQEAYQLLAPEQTLQKAGAARLELATMLDAPAAVALLADALRLEALAQLYLEKADRAAAAFVTSSFLQPDWSPGQDQWPPEARLAHADAIAAARRATPGVLSIRVKPDLAILWLDGRRLGVGETTVSDLTPGEHLLMATAPGHTPVAAVVEVAGGGKLDDASLYLERVGTPSIREQVAVAQIAFDGSAERAASSALSALLDGSHLVLVTSDPVSANGSPVAWVVRPDGRRDRSFISLAPVSKAVPRVADRLVGVTVATTTEPDPEPWYVSPYVWGGAGGVLLIGGGVLVWALLREPTDRVSLYIGRGQVQ